MEQYFSKCRTFAAAYLVLSVASVVHAQTTILGSSAPVGVGGTTEIRVNTSNDLNVAFDTRLIPTGVPDGWGATCYGHMIAPGATDGGTLVATTEIAAGVTTGFRTTYEVYILTGAAIADDAFVSLHVAKGVGAFAFDHPTTRIAYYVQVRNVAGTYKFQILHLTNAGVQTHTWSGSVSTNTVYRHHVEYNLVTRRLIFKVNNETVADVPLDDSAVPNLGTLIMGSSGGSTGREMTFFLDRIEHTPIRSSAAGSIGTRVGKGNAVNLAFDTSLIGIGVPDAWGSTCVAFQVGAGALDGAAIYFITNTGAGITSGFERSFEALFPSSTTNLASNTIVSLAVAKTAGAADIEGPLSLNVWGLHLRRNESGNYRFLFVMESTGGVTAHEWGTNVTLDTTYKLSVKYDLVNDIFEAIVDGETFASGTITAAHRQTIGHLIMGSSVSSTGRDIMFLIDRIEHTPF